MITDADSPFEIGRANVLREGRDAAVFAIGPEVYQALEAARILDAQGIHITVVNMHTIKPLDGACIEKYAALCGCIVTAEEHQINGGFGSAVAEYTALHCPVPIEMVGVRDSFGESGTPDELMEKYHLIAPDIVQAVRAAIARRRG